MEPDSWTGSSNEATASFGKENEYKAGLRTNDKENGKLQRTMKKNEEKEKEKEEEKEKEKEEEKEKMEGEVSDGGKKDVAPKSMSQAKNAIVTSQIGSEEHNQNIIHQIPRGNDSVQARHAISSSRAGTSTPPHCSSTITTAHMDLASESSSTRKNDTSNSKNNDSSARYAESAKGTVGPTPPHPSRMKQRAPTVSPRSNVPLASASDALQLPLWSSGSGPNSNSTSNSSEVMASSDMSIGEGIGIRNGNGNYPGYEHGDGNGNMGIRNVNESGECESENENENGYASDADVLLNEKHPSSNFAFNKVKAKAEESVYSDSKDKDVSISSELQNRNPHLRKSNASRSKNEKPASPANPENPANPEKENKKALQNETDSVSANSKIATPNPQLNDGEEDSKEKPKQKQRGNEQTKDSNQGQNQDQNLNLSLNPNFNLGANSNPRPSNAEEENEQCTSRELTSSDSTSFVVGDIVSVESRTWPGINKPGGMGRISKINGDGTYNVVYILGGTERNVDEEFVQPTSLDAQGVRRPKEREFFTEYDQATQAEAFKKRQGERQRKRTPVRTAVERVADKVKEKKKKTQAQTQTPNKEQRQKKQQQQQQQQPQEKAKKTSKQRSGSKKQQQGTDEAQSRQVESKPKAASFPNESAKESSCASNVHLSCPSLEKNLSTPIVDSAGPSTSGEEQTEKLASSHTVQKSAGSGPTGSVAVSSWETSTPGEKLLDSQSLYGSSEGAGHSSSSSSSLSSLSSASNVKSASKSLTNSKDEPHNASKPESQSMRMTMPTPTPTSMSMPNSLKPLENTSLQPSASTSTSIPTEPPLRVSSSSSSVKSPIDGTSAGDRKRLKSSHNSQTLSTDPTSNTPRLRETNCVPPNYSTVTGSVQSQSHSRSVGQQEYTGVHQQDVKLQKSSTGEVQRTRGVLEAETESSNQEWRKLTLQFRDKLVSAVNAVSERGHRRTLALLATLARPSPSANVNVNATTDASIHVQRKAHAQRQPQSQPQGMLAKRKSKDSLADVNKQRQTLRAWTFVPPDYNALFAGVLNNDVRPFAQQELVKLLRYQEGVTAETVDRFCFSFQRLPKPKSKDMLDDLRNEQNLELNRIISEQQYDLYRELEKLCGNFDQSKLQDKMHAIVPRPRCNF